jgi:hypothetical protein
MELLRNRPGDLKQSGFDMHMNIFKAIFELEFSLFDLLSDFLQTPDQLVAFFSGDDCCFRQHPAMGNAALDVIGVKPPVNLNRGGKGLDNPCRLFRKSSLPEFFGHRFSA